MSSAPAVDRVQKAAADVDHVELTPEAAEQAKQAKPSADGAIVFPLTVTGTRDDVLRRPRTCARS